MTAMFVTTPMTRTASWVTSMWRKLLMTLYSSQMTPERAHPL